MVSNSDIYKFFVLFVGYNLKSLFIGDITKIVLVIPILDIIFKGRGHKRDTASNDI